MNFSHCRWIRGTYSALSFRLAHTSVLIWKGLGVIVSRCRQGVACWADHALQHWDCPPHELALLAVFKNEAHILSEWVQHYRRQGVGLMVLVNNGSTDHYREVLSPFIASGLVVLRHDARRHAQVRMYNRELAFLKARARWLIVCDLDEFIYARPPFRTIAGYLASLEFKVSSIQIPWKMFGSSGHVVQPVDGVIHGFLRRGRFDPAVKLAMMQASGRIECKTIARLKRIAWIDIHRCRCSWGDNLTSDGELAPVDSWQPVNESILRRSSLHLNHYAIQSQQFFRQVKATRGAADVPEYDSVRDDAYFRRYDVNDLVDTELSDITSARACGQVG